MQYTSCYGPWIVFMATRCNPAFRNGWPISEEQISREYLYSVMTLEYANWRLNSISTERSCLMPWQSYQKGLSNNSWKLKHCSWDLEQISLYWVYNTLMNENNTHFLWIYDIEEFLVTLKFKTSMRQSCRNKPKDTVENLPQKYIFYSIWSQKKFFRSHSRSFWKGFRHTGSFSSLQVMPLSCFVDADNDPFPCTSIV